MLAELLAVMAPVLITVALGFAWMRSGRPFDNGLVGSLVMYVGTPCLLLRTFDQVRFSSEAFGEMALATLLSIGGMALVGVLALRVAGLSLRDYLPSLMFPNTANMGLPVALFTYGSDGLALAIVVFAISVVGHYTLGMAISLGQPNLRAVARLPLIYAVAAGVAMILADLHLPAWLGNTVNLLGGLTIPLMLLALGVSLAKLRISGLGPSALVAAIRLGGGFAVALGVATLLGLEGPARGVLLLQGSMPVAVVSYLFAERFGRAAAEVAGTVMISTVASFVTLPLLVLYLLAD